MSKSKLVLEKDLPVSIDETNIVQTAYPSELSQISDMIDRKMSVLIECDKMMSPYIYRQLRDMIKRKDKKSVYIDGRTSKDEGKSIMYTILDQIKENVRGPIDDTILVLPLIDLLSTSGGGLTGEVKEAAALLYENPKVVLIGLKDPSLPMPRIITDLFKVNIPMLGISRDRVKHMVTAKESKKFGVGGLDPYMIYKYLSGVNAVFFRRILSSIDGEDYPLNSKPAIDKLRKLSLDSKLSVPDINLHNDIGGYAEVKEKLQSEIIDILLHKDNAKTEEDIKRIESLIPKGMIFCGPPGTGKTLFAKAMATALGATVIVVSGPELKSKWVGESEENLRRIFTQARQNAPSIIIFDEIDSFASARGANTSSSGVEHSMVNQLLTEMDGFRSDELVFVVGTTNFVESLDQALLRQGRFEFHLTIPYPEHADRVEILKVHNKKMALGMSDKVIDYVASITGGVVPGNSGNQRYSGDHLQAICRKIARKQIRDGSKNIDIAYINGIIDGGNSGEKPRLSDKEKNLIAVHESGHAIVSMFRGIGLTTEKVSINGDISADIVNLLALRKNSKNFLKADELFDAVCILMGGPEAEDMILNDVSFNASNDTKQAYSIAKDIVMMYGIGSVNTDIENSDVRIIHGDIKDMSDDDKKAIDNEVTRIVNDARKIAGGICLDNRNKMEYFTSLLLKNGSCSKNDM